MNYKKFLKYLVIIGIIFSFIGFGFDVYFKNKEINKLKEQIKIEEKNTEDCYNIMTNKNTDIIELEKQLEKKDKIIQNNQSKIEELKSQNKKLANEVSTLKKN